MSSTNSTNFKKGMVKETVLSPRFLWILGIINIFLNVMAKNWCGVFGWTAAVMGYLTLDFEIK